VIFQNEQGNILLMLRESGMYALPTWIQPTETDDLTPYAKCPLPSSVMDCIDTAKVAVRHVSALPTSNHTAYRLCKVSNTSDFSSTLPTPIKWVPLDSGIEREILRRRQTSVSDTTPSGGVSTRDPTEPEPELPTEFTVIGILVNTLLFMFPIICL
jgi:hypothetical protein